MLNVSEWSDWMRAQGRAPNTIARYARVLENFSARGDDTLTPTDVREWREELHRAGYAPAAINAYLAALRSYGAWLVASGQMHANPAAQVRLQKEQALAPRWLSPKEQAALTRAMEKMIVQSQWNTTEARAALRNRAMLWLMLYCGLRVSELCALTVSDVSLRDKSGSLTVRDGKGGKRRVVPVPMPARMAVRDWLEDREAEDEKLFGVTPRMTQKIVEQCARRAEVDCTPHTLRHTYAHNLRVAEVSLDKIATLLGHSRLSTTMRYTLPSERELAEAVSVLE